MGNGWAAFAMLVAFIAGFIVAMVASSGMDESMLRSGFYYHKNAVYRVEKIAGGESNGR